ncbi:hypothetical protein B1813_18845 [Saccharomonospora piscinae]|uniref:Uncharacterized protein n=1 Tax=Saccharomonospora piscinae TaxID=687388 RepID=A0A1V8ZYM5_SACPI|nr:hypothetical protein [Saccharomonospora piscinae]OQO89900.1 hypothetical protein B1813_18845 [Saccharomonospora piscinae]
MTAVDQLRAIAAHAEQHDIAHHILTVALRTGEVGVYIDPGADDPRGGFAAWARSIGIDCATVACGTYRAQGQTAHGLRVEIVHSETPTKLPQKVLSLEEFEAGAR